MPYINPLDFEKKIIADIDSNRPAGLYQKHVQYPGRTIKQPTRDDFIRVVIDYQDRERVAVGTGEFEIMGEVRLYVYSPTAKNQSGHYSIVDSYRQIYDDQDVDFVTGIARFSSSQVQTSGEIEGFFLTSIIFPFSFREYTSNINVSQLVGKTLVEQILYALVLPAPDQVRNYLLFEVVDPSYVQVIDGPNPHVQLEIRAGQPLVNGGVRAEATVDWPFVDGDIVEYSWRIMIPTGFTNDAANGNRFWIMGQWHDKPLSGDGGTGNSPPLSFAFGEVSGANYLSFEYLGDTPDPADLIPVPFDTWVNIKVKVWWTQQATGKAEVYVNDVLNQTENGANMLNSLSHFLKVGQYRHPDIATTNFVNIDDIRIATVGTFTP